MHPLETYLRELSDIHATSAVAPHLRTVAAPAREGGGQLDPRRDLGVTARWGVAGKNGVTMPGRGRVVARDYTPDERLALAAGAESLGIAPERALALLGGQTCDVYLNEAAYWRNVPLRVWEYTLGGYPVMKK